MLLGEVDSFLLGAIGHGGMSRDETDDLLRWNGEGQDVPLRSVTKLLVRNAVDEHEWVEQEFALRRMGRERRRAC